MATETLYSDIDFTLGLIYNGSTPTDVALKEDLFDIFQSIKNIILTGRTERPFSTVGAGLYEFKYEKMSQIELAVLQQTITANLGILEPRAIINSINIQQTLPEQLTVEVNFSPVYNPALTRIKSIQV